MRGFAALLAAFLLHPVLAYAGQVPTEADYMLVDEMDGAALRPATTLDPLVPDPLPPALKVKLPGDDERALSENLEITRYNIEQLRNYLKRLVLLDPSAERDAAAARHWGLLEEEAAAEAELVRRWEERVGGGDGIPRRVRMPPMLYLRHAETGAGLDPRYLEEDILNTRRNIYGLKVEIAHLKAENDQAKLAEEQAKLEVESAAHERLLAARTLRENAVEMKRRSARPKRSLKKASEAIRKAAESFP